MLLSNLFIFAWMSLGSGRRGMEEDLTGETELSKFGEAEVFEEVLFPLVSDVRLGRSRSLPRSRSLSLSLSFSFSLSRSLSLSLFLSRSLSSEPRLLSEEDDDDDFELLSFSLSFSFSLCLVEDRSFSFSRSRSRSLSFSLWFECRDEEDKVEEEEEEEEEEEQRTEKEKEFEEEEEEFEEETVGPVLRFEENSTRRGFFFHSNAEDDIKVSSKVAEDKQLQILQEDEDDEPMEFLSSTMRLKKEVLFSQTEKSTTVEGHGDMFSKLFSEASRDGQPKKTVSSSSSLTLSSSVGRQGSVVERETEGRVSLKVERPQTQSMISARLNMKDKELFSPNLYKRLQNDRRYNSYKGHERSFRVCWGASGLLAIPGRATHRPQPTLFQINAKTTTPSLPSSLSIIKLPAPDGVNVEKLLEEIYLVPHRSGDWEESPGTALEEVVQRLSTYLQPDTNQHSSPLRQSLLLWTLLSALSRPLPSHSFPPENEKAQNFQEGERVGAVSVWLQQALRSAPASRLSGADSYLDNQLSLLTGKQLTAAVELAIKNKDFRLACLVPQAFNTDLRVKNQMLRQLFESDENDVRYRAILCLLSGRVDYFLGNGSPGRKLVASDWKRRFGVCLWFGHLEASLEKSLSLFSECSPADAPAPPPYLENSFAGKDLSWNSSTDCVYDLLRFHCDLPTSSSFLLPLSWTPLAQDFHLSYHLLSALRTIYPLEKVCCCL
eukprot:TRINITY_DN1266_c1_g4_i2.p1 TRINITY_DN1266_c1_g4~~TRINITY_DN1266_c1_g4_i2.p1  ORF type:complete len:718 (-),score=188.80 TRINITY_DN1266_c1_g4_i2:990-3143(-)